MFLSYKAPLKLTTVQKATFLQYAGTARKIWNWGLAECRKALDEKRKILARGIARDLQEMQNACGLGSKPASSRKRRLGKKQEKDLPNVVVNDHI